MADSNIAIDSNTAAVCELFAGSSASATYHYLLRSSESPLQVPFHYLALIAGGRVVSTAPRQARLTAEQVSLGYRAILQRSPEDHAIVEHHLELRPDPGDFLAALLTSTEVSLRMPQLFAQAFPLLNRLWHVHIPKTAGSSFFSAAVDSDWSYVNTNLLSDARGDLRLAAQGVRLRSTKSGWAIISGHWPLFQHLGSIGPFDRVVVFVRDPLECLVSEFNYAVDVVNGSKNVHQGRPTEFLARGLDPTSFQKSYAAGFFNTNSQCHFLALDGTCESALKNLAACNGELSPSDTVEQCIAKFFPKVRNRWDNVSNKHFRSRDIGPAMREELLLKNQHDFLLHQIAESRQRSSRQPLAAPLGRAA
jgi:hypothetical protein